jgi:DNA-binding transcriptional MerR regulator
MIGMIIANINRTEGRRYMISDAAKIVDVESHVLRYWEEELEIEIPRNEMGHRYYTDYYINIFRKIKELKDQGFLLKAIKIALPEIMEGNNIDALATIKTESKGEHDVMPIQITDSKPSKMEQFQMILGNIVTAALLENNKNLSKELSQDISDSVIKEMDYLLRMKEEKEEERFKKFDEMVRGLQRDNKMAAMRQTEKKKKLFGKR